MRLPTIRGIIDRRVLVNYRVDPEVLSSTLPAPFRPQIVEGYGIAGICLIRLRQLRPAMLPAFTGFGSENAAHRIAVEWDSDEGLRTGVFVPRRDTSSMFTTLAGGRIFPGVHHHAAFDVQETGECLQIQMRSLDGSAHVRVDARATSELSADSIFESTESVSRFFEDGSHGYSLDQSGRCFEGLELRTMNWQVQPLSVSKVESSFFNDRAAFPEGSVTFDNALLMSGIDHEWHSCEAIPCSP
ncbi:MAG: DUF2071 domain-containing protein [Planctomycetales bacterium]